jgi:co-chaperonin GroES (HSP10)
MIEYFPEPAQDFMIIEEEQVDAGPILLADTARGKITELSQYNGHVVKAIGPWGVTHDDQGHEFEHGVKVGDVVIIEGLNAPAFEYRKKRYIITRARYVACVIKVKGTGPTEDTSATLVVNQ